MKEFNRCMERLFTSLAYGKSYKNVNRLDLFKVLFDDRQKEIDKLERSLKMIQSESEGLKWKIEELEIQNKKSSDLCLDFALSYRNLIAKNILLNKEICDNCERVTRCSGCRFNTDKPEVNYSKGYPRNPLREGINKIPKNKTI